MPIKWSISNSDTKAVITMKFEDYSPEIQAKLMEIGNAAADAVESQESPAEGIPEDSPNFSPELELSRLIKPNWNTLMPALRRWYCSCMSVANHGKQLVASSVSRVKLLVCDMPRWKDHGNNCSAS